MELGYVLPNSFFNFLFNYFQVLDQNVQMVFLIWRGILKVTMAMFVETTNIMVSMKDGIAFLDVSVEIVNLGVYSPVPHLLPAAQVG